MTTLPEALERNAAATPEGVAIRFEGRTVTYAEFLDEVVRCANGLARCGIGRGDRVAVMMHNAPECFIALHAIWRLGAVQVPVNALLREEEAAHILCDSGARAAIADGGCAQVVAAARAQAPDLQTVAVVDGEGGDLLYAELLQLGADAPAPPLPEPGELAVIAYTSGTTGVPKGAMLPHRHFADYAHMSRSYFGLSADDDVLQGLPAFHTNASMNGLLLAWFLGSSGTLLRRLDVAGLIEAVPRSRPSIFTVVPTVMVDLAGLADSEAPDLSSVRYVVFGAAPAQPAVRRRIEERFGLRMVQAYGMTEVPYIALDPVDGPIVDGAAGRPVTYVDVRIRDDDTELPPGATGEICVRAHPKPDEHGLTFHPILGYWNDPDKTEEAMRGGVFHTGDVGFLDEQGFLHVVDRKKDMIIRGGTNVYPAELERVLQSEPGVQEAYVVGLPDERLGEVPKAYVVPAPGAQLNPEALREAANARVARFKRIEQLELVAADALPRTPMGKVLKRELRTW